MSLLSTLNCLAASSNDFGGFGLDGRVVEADEDILYGQNAQDAWDAWDA
jgi:hypothetical protein